MPSRPCLSAVRESSHIPISKHSTLFTLPPPQVGALGNDNRHLQDCGDH